MNLFYLLLVPALTAIAVLLFRSASQIRLVALFGAILQLALSIWLYVRYTASALADADTILFRQKIEWFSAWNIAMHVGVDGISISMILLTAFVVIAGILVSWNVEKKPKEFFFLLSLLSFGAYGFFISLDLFVLFFFLEIAVIPKYLLIGIWGSGRKEYSANKLALMLMGGSALVLVGMLGLYFSNRPHSFDLLALSQTNIRDSIQMICFPLLFVGFGVFTAIFPFHTWVPDGHSSAPTAGSMFLAGISMKLGGYGCLRVAMFLLPHGAREYAPAIIGLATIAILYGAFATMMQKGLKYMNAYSSISHCGFVLLGMGMLTQTATTGAVLQMVSHGVMTALFFAVIGMIYERTHTRQVNEMGGLLAVMPFTITIFFIVGLCSLGLPALSGFVAEMTILVGSWEQKRFLFRLATVAACVSILVTAVYILRAIGRVAMGSLRTEHASVTDASWNEKLAAVLLVAAILCIGIFPGWLTRLIEPASEIIIQRINTLK